MAETYTAEFDDLYGGDAPVDCGFTITTEIEDGEVTSIWLTVSGLQRVWLRENHGGLETKALWRMWSVWARQKYRAELIQSAADAEERDMDRACRNVSRSGAGRGLAHATHD